LKVQISEPGTLTYLVHRPLRTYPGLQSLPPVDPLSVLFFEVYQDANAFSEHVNGPVFTGFVAQYGDLFVSANGKPYTTVEFLTTRAGFTRAQAPGAEATTLRADGQNRHPGVMFEIIAKDQDAIKSFYSKVFGWKYQTGTGGFAYVHFTGCTPPLLGGIGQANPAIPGFEPGHSFYLLVDNVEDAIERAVAAHGKRHMEPATVEGYRFAMIEDPEGNPVGLIEPFTG
jgi:hypothetical protein